MSGRTRHLRDGKWITNRKTDRRQSPARSPLQIAHDLNKAHADRHPEGGWKRGIRMGFLLPDQIAAFVADGGYGIGVHVFRGFVQVSSHSIEGCLISAGEFLAIVAKGKPAFQRPASIVNIEQPERSCGRWLSVVNGAVVMSSGMHGPQIYEGKA